MKLHVGGTGEEATRKQQTVPLGLPLLPLTRPVSVSGQQMRWLGLEALPMHPGPAVSPRIERRTGTTYCPLMCSTCCACAGFDVHPLSPHPFAPMQNPNATPPSLAALNATTKAAQNVHQSIDYKILMTILLDLISPGAANSASTVPAASLPPPQISRSVGLSATLPLGSFWSGHTEAGSTK